MERIAIFDSSIGGLSILKEAIKNFKGIQFEYLADTLYYPYGEKREDLIKERLKKILSYFEMRKCGILIIACSTASGIYEKNKKYFKGFFSGKIYTMLNQTLCEEIEKCSRNKKISIISTTLTKKLGQFKKYIEKNSSLSIIEVKEAPLLVEKITLGKINSEETKNLAKKYIAPLIKHSDTLVLGCTHFHFISTTIKKICSEKNVSVIEPAKTSIKHIKNLHKELRIKKGQNEIILFSTSNINDFYKMALKIAKIKVPRKNYNITNIEKNLSRYAV